MLVILARAPATFPAAKRQGSLAVIDLDHDQWVTVIDHVARSDNDLQDRTGNVGKDRNLHLHRLQDHHRVIGRHPLADLHLDLHHGRDELGDDGMAHAAIVGFAGVPFR